MARTLSASSTILYVVITLARPLDGLTAERLARAAIATAPGVSVTTGGTTITLTLWPRGTGDLLLLAHFLATWGDELHGELGIAAVAFARGGPIMSI